jgi:hypothetical protein
MYFSELHITLLKRKRQLLAAFQKSFVKIQEMYLFIYLFIHNCLCVLGESTTPHPSFPPDLCLYVNLDAKGAQKLFKTLAPQLTVLGIPHFC